MSNFTKDMKKEVKDMKKKVEQINEEKDTLASTIISDYKCQNKRLFIIIIFLIIAWFTTIGIFVYHLETTGYEEITEEATTDDGGNACVGDNCNNGEINYGESKTNY